MSETPILLPDLTADWKAIRNLSDAIFECVQNAVQSLVDECDLPDDEDAIDLLTARVYALATTGEEEPVPAAPVMDLNLFLVCDDCGEAFDANEPSIAYAHIHDIMIDARFFVQTEDEAF